MKKVARKRKTCKRNSKEVGKKVLNTNDNKLGYKVCIKVKNLQSKSVQKMEGILRESWLEKQQGFRPNVRKKSSKNLGKKISKKMVKNKATCKEGSHELDKKVYKKIVRNWARRNKMHQGNTQESMHVAGKQVRKYAIQVASIQERKYSNKLGIKLSKKQRETRLEICKKCRTKLANSMKQ